MLRRRVLYVLLVGAGLACGAPTHAIAADGRLLSLTPQRVGGDGAVMVGDRFRIRVVMQPHVAGQVVNVRIFRGSHRVAVVDVPLSVSSTGRSGFAVVPFSSQLHGNVEVRATHVATPEAPELQATPVRVAVLPRGVRPGSRGVGVRLLQLQLARLGYVVGQRGFYDARTARAVQAFRKVAGMTRTTVASSGVFRALARGAGRFDVRYPSHGKHIEADLSRQVLALIRHGRVERIYPTSSGAPVTPSPIGSFKVYLKTPGTNAKGMVHSSYFLRGYAVHGYADVPVFAASHGCLRVPVPDALSIFEWIGTGDRVDVYQ